MYLDSRWAFWKMMPVQLSHSVSDSGYSQNPRQLSLKGRTVRPPAGQPSPESEVWQVLDLLQTGCQIEMDTHVTGFTENLWR